MRRACFPFVGLLALLSAGAHCETSPPADIGVSWSIERDGQPLTCEEVRGGFVRVTMTGDSLLGAFPCEDGQGLLQHLEPGGYHLTFRLYDELASDIQLAEADLPMVTTSDHPQDLGPVVLEMVAERCRGWDDDRDGDVDCDDSDCADKPECAPPAEDCAAEGDEDQDGDADCADADCAGEPACNAVCTANEVTIAAVYTLGGSGGAAYKRDFVVLENRTNAAYDLTGHSLQTATVSLDSWDLYALPAESIPANGAYLVAIGTGGSQGADLPTPDESFAGAGNLNDTALLAIALMPDATPLAACPTGAAIDLFSAAEDACSEGTTVASPGTDAPTEWYARGGDGCDDSDDNAADFAVATAGTPRNSASAPIDCTCP